MYQLLNKDVILASFDITTKDGGDILNLEVASTLPIGVTPSSLMNWIEGRFAAKHRKHLAQYLYSIGANNIYGFIKVSHCISINDTYWIKESTENIHWRDVSPYTNDFDEVVQSLAFDGKGLNGEALSSTSPEFGTSGNFAKCWVRENDGIYLYKRGSEGFSNAGLEPYSEYLASQVFVQMKCGIPYELVNYRGQVATRCKLFTDERIGYVPYGAVSAGNRLSEIKRRYESIGCLEQFCRRLVCDAITFNVDRHFGNFGFLYDLDASVIKSIDPGFDYNMALFPLEVDDAFCDTSSFMYKYVPKRGNDFVEVARDSLVGSIRNDLVNLRCFKYAFDGDDKFSKKRVEWLTQLSNQQIDKILGVDNSTVYINPNTDCASNVYKYKLYKKLSDEEFRVEVPRLMKLFGISHMAELEERLGLVDFKDL